MTIVCVLTHKIIWICRLSTMIIMITKKKLNYAVRKRSNNAGTSSRAMHHALQLKPSTGASQNFVILRHPCTLMYKFGAFRELIVVAVRIRMLYTVLVFVPSLLWQNAYFYSSADIVPNCRENFTREINFVVWRHSILTSVTCNDHASQKSPHLTVFWFAGWPWAYDHITTGRTLVHFC